MGIVIAKYNQKSLENCNSPEFMSTNWVEKKPDTTVAGRNKTVMIVIILIDAESLVVCCVKARIVSLSF